MAKVTDLLKNNGEPVTLSTGIRVILKPAPSLLIEEAANNFEYPPVPRQTVDGIERENPNDPDYIQAIQKIDRKRSQASLDAMLLFSIDLVDGVPEDDAWVKKLKYLERLNHIDFGDYDFDDEFDREFLYKKYIATSNDDWFLIGQINGIQQEDVDTFKASFRGQETRNTD